MELGRTRRSARQEEVRKRSNDLVEFVDESLQRIDVAGFHGRDPRPAWVIGWPAQVGANVEQLILDPGQDRGEALAQSRRQRDAKLGVQFVDRAVGRHSGRILRHALATTQAGRPIVARLRIDPRQARHPISIVRPSGEIVACSCSRLPHPVEPATIRRSKMEDIT